MTGPDPASSSGSDEKALERRVTDIIIAYRAVGATKQITALIREIRADERARHEAFLREIAEAFTWIACDGDVGYEANRFAHDWADRINQHLERGEEPSRG